MTLTFKHSIRLKLAALALALIATPALHAQGCAQCRDNLQANPPAVQTAYRHAIELLGTAGLLVFIAGILALRRLR